MRAVLIAIVGPTGVGKTELALGLAETLSVEVVSADSRQVYRGMDIGTAKPTPVELSRLPHHLIDILDPDQDFSLAEYQEQAYAAIDAIGACGRLPLLVGGTGQYVHAVVEGWRIPRVRPDPALRERLYAEAEQLGAQSLYTRLIEMDPAAASFVDVRNVRRVVRALEVCIKSGQPFSEQRGKAPPPYAILSIGLTMEREALYQRVDARIDAMLAHGLADEVRRLLDGGYGWELPAMSGLGYLQFRPYVEGTASLEEVTAAIKKETRRFVRHQYNWFRLDDPRIHWLEANARPLAEARARIDEWLDGMGAHP
jgi:tRNA dimethylallyltransferase